MLELYILCILLTQASGSDGKESAPNTGDPGFVPGSGRSPGEGNGYPLQYSCLGDPIDRGAWQAKAIASKELEMTEQLSMFPIILWGYWRLSSVQSLHQVWLFAAPWTSARQASLSITNSWTFSNSSTLSRWGHPTSHPLSSSSPPALNLSQHQGLFKWVSSTHKVAKVLEFQLQHQSFQRIFRVDFLLDWLVWSPCSPRDTQEYLQHHSSKASILQCSSFFIVQMSHLYMTNRKTIALIRWIFVGKVMSLLFDMLSSLVIAFLPRSSHLLISWLQSPSAVILESKKIKSVSFHCFPIYLPWSDGTWCHDLSFLNVEL